MTTAEAIASVKRLPWGLWLRQAAAIVRLDLRKNLFSRRGIWIYFLAFAPTFVLWLHGMIDRPQSMREDTLALAGMFQFYYLRLAIFFGCLGIFTRLIRGEMVERSLHYYLLAPVRREVLVIAKFVSGAITAMVVFGVAVFADVVLMYRPFGAAGSAWLWNGPGLHHLLMYLAITALACLGYGALFLAFSLTVKNPIVPAVVVMGWEAINPMLPSLLQKVSVIFYLRHLMPVEVPARGIPALLSVVAEPVPAWLAVSGVFCVTALVLVYACFRVRRLEISYTTD